MKHTPGPWFPINYAGYWSIQSKDEYSETDVLNVEHHDNAEDNAKLIAAAPDLLEALINMRKAFDLSNEKYSDWVATKEVYDAMSVIDSAIKKATG